MHTEEKINFRQDRDFGETFNITVKFIRQNFKHFFTTLILIAGPFILIGAIASAVYQANALGLFYNTFSVSETYDILGRYRIFALLYYMFYFIASIVTIAVTGAYMILYSEKGPGNFTTREVGNLVLRNTGKLILTSLALLVLLLPVIAAYAGLGVLAAAGNNVALIIIYAFILLVGMGIFLPNFSWLLPSVYFVAMQEKKSAFSSISRTFQLMRGSYWWTWLIMFVGIIAIYVLILVFSLPQIIYYLVITFSHAKGTFENYSDSSVFFIAITTICTFFTFILCAVAFVLCGFHYYSLAERKDGTGLLSRIDEIGNTADTNVEQQY